MNLNTRDFQPKIFSIEERDDVEFDEFEGTGKYAEHFLRNLLSFHGDNSFFISVL